MPKQVKFFKYQCPYDELLQGFEADQDNERYGLINLDGSENEDLPRFKKGPSIGPAIVGDMGVLPINEKTLMSKNFNLWMIHTNFSINQQVSAIVENCPGVETWDVISRYRGRVGFGKIFDANEIKITLEKLLCVEKVATTITNTSYNNLGEFLTSKYKFWSILTIRDRILVPIHGNSIEEVLEKMNKEKDVNSVIKSWE